MTVIKAVFAFIDNFTLASIADKSVFTAASERTSFIIAIAVILEVVLSIRTLIYINTCISITFETILTSAFNLTYAVEALCIRVTIMNTFFALIDICAFQTIISVTSNAITVI